MPDLKSNHVSYSYQIQKPFHKFVQIIKIKYVKFQRRRHPAKNKNPLNPAQQAPLRVIKDKPDLPSQNNPATRY